VHRCADRFQKIADGSSEGLSAASISSI